MISIRRISAIALTAGAAAACSREPAPSGHHDHHGHDHGTVTGGDEHGHAAHGSSVDLGEQISGGLRARAFQGGPLKAGTDAAVNVSITPESGATVTAVRAWIGGEDAKGALKAKLELEGDQWHSHVETPDPLAPAARLWVEVETTPGGKRTLGFDAKR